MHTRWRLAIDEEEEESWDLVTGKQSEIFFNYVELTYFLFQEGTLHIFF